MFLYERFKQPRVFVEIISAMDEDALTVLFGVGKNFFYKSSRAFIL
jgi:hypothetical protein